MKHCRLLTIIGITASALLLNSATLHAQSGKGELTVTAVVVASVGVQIGPDGNPTVIVANASDPRDNVSQLSPVSADTTKKPAKKADHHK